jgi:hypothetical protein
MLGSHIISSVYYPYQNEVQKEAMDRNSNFKFGVEFSHYLDSFLYSLQGQAGITSSLPASVTNTGGASVDLSLDDILKRRIKANRSSIKSGKASDLRSSIQSI